MKNFKFRMQTVLDQRERVETVAKQTFAEADAVWQRGKSLLGDLCEIRDALLSELCRVNAESGFDPSEMRLYQGRRREEQAGAGRGARPAAIGAYGRTSAGRTKFRR